MDPSPVAGSADTSSGPAPRRAGGSVHRALEVALTRAAAMPASAWITLVVVGVCMGWVASVVHPPLLVTDTLPTGGDMGAHVWSPAYLRDHLLPHGRLIGWSPDWYAGFPAFQFYMVLPSLVVVWVNAGPSATVAVPALVALAGAALLARRVGWPHRVGAGTAVTVVAVVVALVGVPYGVAFKLVAVGGLVAMPVAGWALGRLAGLAFPGPALLALATMPFLFDRSFNIFGGNVASTMAGEFAFSLSLSLSLVFLGLLIRAADTGRQRGWAAVVLALVGLTHLFPAVWVAVVGAFYLALRLGRTQLSTALTVFPVAGLLGAFWALPFYWKRTYLNDMGWGKLDEFRSLLVTRDVLNPAETLRDSPPLEVVLALAAVGLVLCLVTRNRLGVALALSALTVALVFIHLPEGRLWNGRILPFYYLSLYLLAALGIYEAVRLLSAHRWLRWGAGAMGCGLVVTEALRAAATGAGIDDRVSRVLPGTGASWVAVALAGVLAASLAARGGPRGVDARGVDARRVDARRVDARRVIAAVGAGSVWLGATVVPAHWWRPASGASGPVAVTLESVLGPLAHAVLHVLEYPAAYLVVGIAVVQAAGLVREVPLPSGAGGVRLARFAAAPLALVALVLVFGPSLRSLPFGTVGADGAYRWGLPDIRLAPRDASEHLDLPGLQLVTHDVSFLPGWASWNFSGYERKRPTESSGGYPELYGLVTTMAELGADPAHGCGRAMWEYGPRLEGYGTPMAPMLLPHFTDGCVTSMEGLYFEASSTTPYHFLTQSALSKQPSSPQRGLPYPGFDIDLGVRQLQLMGVRYYLAFSDTAVEAAEGHRDLTRIATSGPWHIYTVDDAELVVPLEHRPVVYEGLGHAQHEWLAPAARFFNDPASYDVVRAADGPEDWPRIAAPPTELASPGDTDGSTPVEVPREPVPQVRVSGVETGRDHIRFEVDRPGVPVLVKVSYFPNWRASGADGPYRVTPNLMVVIPTGPEVELRYATTTVDRVSQGLTVLGLLALIPLWRHRARPAAAPWYDLVGRRR